MLHISVCVFLKSIKFLRNDLCISMVCLLLSFVFVFVFVDSLFVVVLVELLAILCICKQSFSMISSNQFAMNSRRLISVSFTKFRIRIFLFAKTSLDQIDTYVFDFVHCKLREHSSWPLAEYVSFFLIWRYKLIFGKFSPLLNNF